jgi:hypothetical protein
MSDDPHNRDAPSPARRAAGPGWPLVLAVFGVVNLALLIAVFLLPSLASSPEFAVAERFAAALVDGPDGEERSGYDRAYDLLSESMRREWSLQDWVALFEDRAAERGFLEEMTLDPDGVSGTSSVRQLVYRLRFSGIEGNFVTERVTLVLHRGPSGPRVAALQFMD